VSFAAGFGVAVAVFAQILVGGSLPAGFAHVDDAPFPPTCRSVDRKVDGTDTNTSGQPQNGQRGIRSNMWVTDDISICSRISSIAVFNADNNRVIEWGWVLGYGCTANQYFHNPRMFMVDYDFDTGVYDCEMTGVEPQEGSSPRANLHTDGGGVWVGQLSGQVYAGDTLPFSSGYGRTNAERDNPQDSAWSNFHAIQEYYWDQGWNDWDDVQLFDDTDPDFIFCRWSGHHHGVEGPPCDTTQ
jgi:hypothetical protein